MNNSLTGLRERTPSLTTRLTVWYAISSMALVSFSTWFLYWSLERTLAQRDVRLLADKMGAIRLLLSEQPNDFEALRRRVEKEWPARISERVYVRVLDGQRQIVTETPDASEKFPKAGRAFEGPGLTRKPDSEPQLIRFEESAFRTLAATVTPLLGSGRSYDVQLALDRSEESELLREYRVRLTVVLAAAVVLCVLFSFKIARRGMLPVHEIARTAGTITSSKLDERMQPERMPGELANLARTFNGMLDRLKESFERLQRFSADIAHELRTPVNNIRGEIEVALGKERSAESYRETMASVLEESGRLTHIIDSLLFLARCESPEMELRKERLSLHKELTQILAFYEAPASERGLCCRIEADESLSLSVERTLFQRAVGNLVSNAIKHSGRPGELTLAAFRGTEGIHIEIRDSGIGIPEEHRAHLFDRFYRVDKARAKDSGGSGLGLAIVKSIVQIHGGVVELFSQPGIGTTARITFPSHS